MKRHPQPIVAIIGRPNVGKSTLFNRIIGRRKASVLDTPGLTRDRNYAMTEWNKKPFLLVDTGGYDPVETDDISVRVREHVMMAIDEADGIIFLTDVAQLDHPVDYEIVDMLRKSGKPFILAINKCDNHALERASAAFGSFGCRKMLAISSAHGLGIGELLDGIVEPLPEAEAETEDGDEIRVAIVGRQNTGKSTLVNKILGVERVIASPVAGTTRDAVDTPLCIGDKQYVIIDTAGIRRRGKIQRGPEDLSVTSSIMSIQRCDVAILLLDANEGISAQDMHIGGYIQDAFRAAIIIVNKWDLIEKDTNTAGAFAKKIKEGFNFMPYAPILFISALTGQRVRKIFDLIDEVIPEYRARIETSVLNNVLHKILQRHQPPIQKGRQLKIKYITQTDTAPPTFTLFVNDPALLHFSYERFMRNQFAIELGLSKTPIRLKLRRKTKD